MRTPAAIRIMTRRITTFLPARAFADTISRIAVTYQTGTLITINPNTLVTLRILRIAFAEPFTLLITAYLFFRACTHATYSGNTRLAIPAYHAFAIRYTGTVGAG